MSEPLCLRSFGFGVRLGVACLVLMMIGGLLASAAYVHVHYAPRDQSPGVSMTDLVGSYHGIDAPSPLLETLEAGHPEEMSDENRQALLAWLRGDRISQNYDNLNLGDDAPAELIAMNCLECHSRRASDEHELAKAIPLDYWDDVSRLAFPMRIDPPPLEILLVSTHTHALSLATITGLTAILLLLTCWPRRLVGLLVGLSGLALIVDLGCWWLSRMQPEFVYLMAIAGGTYLITTGLAQVAILVDVCLPMNKRIKA